MSREQRRGRGVGKSFKRSDPSDPRVSSAVQIFVEGLPKSVKIPELVNFFSSAGKIKVDKATKQPRVWLYHSKETGEATGECTITYNDTESQQEALKVFNSADFGDCKLTVTPSIVKSHMANPPKPNKMRKFTKRLDHGYGRGGRGRGRGGRDRRDDSRDRYPVQRSREYSERDSRYGRVEEDRFSRGYDRNREDRYSSRYGERRDDSSFSGYSRAREDDYHSRYSRKEDHMPDDYRRNYDSGERSFSDRERYSEPSDYYSSRQPQSNPYSQSSYTSSNPYERGEPARSYDYGNGREYDVASSRHRPY